MWQLANFDFDTFVSSFMDRDEFSHASTPRLWRYEYAPELKDVYVRCTFKNKLIDSATDSKAAWKPHLPPNASGWQATNPEGLIFLKKSDDWKYTQPDFSDPGLEKWTTDVDSPDASGWQRDKVIKDIREVAKVENFTVAQVEEWEALFDFHLRHQSPESLPMAPHQLTTATTGRSVTLHGMPISWAEMWQTLRRLPRPHLSSAPVAASSQPSSSSSALSTSKDVKKGLAFENDVTGTNHPKREREKEADLYKMRVDVAHMPKSLSTIDVGQLYFIALPSFEGEMAVGVGRTSKLFTEGPSVVKADVQWLTRRSWSNTVSNEGFLWAKSPMFDAYMVSGRIVVNEHPIDDFLPVQVELTDGSVHNASKSLSVKTQRFCLNSKCIVRLREFCTRVRPDLIRVGVP